MTTAIYARYSSDLQSERSIEDQIVACKEYAKRIGLHEPFVVYSDAALSGASMATRPGLQRLMDDMGARKMVAVVSEAIDRLSRDQADVHLIRRASTLSGVKLYTICDGEVTSMVAGLKGIIAEAFLIDLAQKTRRGLIGVARSGRSAGGRCYGYRIVAGEVRGQREIDEKEAAIVRRIYSSYSSGVSPLKLVKEFNAESIPSPRGGPWRVSTLNGDVRAGDGILCQDLYRGRLVFNRRRFVKNPTTGRRSSILNPETEWVVVEAPELRIVDDNLWSAVQARRRSVSPAPGTPPQKRPQRLLSGLLRCGICGSGCSIVGPEIYGCSAVRQSGECQQRKTIPAKKLDARVLAGLKRILLSPELVAEAVEAYHKELNAERARASRRRLEIERDLAELARRIDRLAEQLIETGAKALQPRLLAAEAEQATLEAQLAQEPEPEIVSLNPRAAEIYRARVADLETALVGGADVPTREAIRELISTIELLPDENERDGWRITIHGDLGALLALANEKTPGVSAEGFFVRNHQPRLRKISHSVGVGAGVGFEPTTFRL
jgi:site-specific DNA recombinase